MQYKQYAPKTHGVKGFFSVITVTDIDPGVHFYTAVTWNLWDKKMWLVVIIVTFITDFSVCTEKLRISVVQYKNMDQYINQNINQYINIYQILIVHNSNISHISDSPPPPPPPPPPPTHTHTSHVYNHGLNVAENWLDNLASLHLFRCINFVDRVQLINAATDEDSIIVHQ